MELFATDLERLAFLLEADAALTLDPDTLGTHGLRTRTSYWGEPQETGP